MNILIRAEKPEDRKEIFALNALAFGQDNEGRLVDLLRESNAFIPGLSLVALVEGQIVGHILFSKIRIVDGHQREYESLALAPMAVLPEFQNKGIGSVLVRTGLDQAKKLGFKSVIVLGHERYYPKFGFAPAESWQISAPFEVPKNVFMAIELVPDGLLGVHGTVHYPEAFAAV